MKKTTKTLTWNRHFEQSEAVQASLRHAVPAGDVMLSRQWVRRMTPLLSAALALADAIQSNADGRHSPPIKRNPTHLRGPEIVRIWARKDILSALRKAALPP